MCRAITHTCALSGAKSVQFYLKVTPRHIMVGHREAVLILCLNVELLSVCS